MRAISVREALSGPWCFSFAGWLALFVPGTTLVILQEAGTPFPNFGYVLVSAVFQHLAAGLVALPASIALHRSTRLLPLWSSVSTWTVIGVAHGLIGGAIASAFAEVSPSFPLRISTWLLASWVWIPFYSYAAAQRQKRNEVLSALTAAIHQRDDARELQERSAEQIRRQLLTAIQTTVEGVIADVRRGLSTAQKNLDPVQFESMGARVAFVSHQVDRVVRHVTHSVAEKPQRTPRSGAALKLAHTFERRHPWLWSSITCAALTVVLAPMCLRYGGWTLIIELLAAMMLVTVVLALGPRAVPRGLRHWCGQLAWAFARYSVAGISGTMLLAATRWGRWDSFSITIAFVLPYAIVFSAALFSAAVGLEAANRCALRSLDAIEAERVEFEAAAQERENSIRGQLAEVLHGPVLGRLAACAMALNFHAAELESAPHERTEQVTSAVLNHLDAVTTDLNALIH